jgi:hypothetical protein
MFHDLVDGLPIEVDFGLKELEVANASIEFRFIGMELFEECISFLDDAKIEALLGIAVTSRPVGRISKSPQCLRNQDGAVGRSEKTRLSARHTERTSW